MPCQPYAQLIEMKRWADRGLYEAVEQSLPRLSSDDTALLRLVLDHIQVVDRIFQHHLMGTPHAFSAPRSAMLPTFEALAEGARAVDDWYVAFVGGLSKSDLEQPVDFVFTSGKPARMRRGEIILHVCLHGTYHRGNAGALLQLRGFAPSPDAVTDFLEAVA
jgi:uncharacterized damage-inducible protein DinB